MMISAKAQMRREKYWSQKVRCMLMSRKRIPYMASLSSMSSRSYAAMNAISGMQSPEL